MPNIQRVQTNEELVKELQNRILTNSLSGNEIDSLTSILVKKTGRCFFCGKVEEVSNLMEIKLNEKEVKRFLVIKWLDETEGKIKNLTLRQKLIAGYQENAKNERLQNKLREIGKSSLGDFFSKQEKK